MIYEDRPVCRRCVLPESPPDILMDGSGLCNVCREHDAARENYDGRAPLETDFTRILNKHRGKHEYDCLVMCSGGKDSTAALYYMKERYKVRPLAFTFDHGFETEDALDNIHRAVKALDVDFVTFRSTRIHGLLRKLLSSGSRAVICHVCSIWYMDLTFRMAARYDVPLIIAGWTKGQSTDQSVMSKCACNVGAPEYGSMARATEELLDGLKNDPDYKDFPRSMEEVLKRARKRHKSLVLSPHWFLGQDVDTYVNTIREKLGWDYPEVSYPAGSTNCYLNYLAVHNSMKYYGFTHYHVEMSKMIREGLMTRDEALEQLKTDYDLDFLNGIAEQLGHRFED